MELKKMTKGELQKELATLKAKHLEAIEVKVAEIQRLEKQVANLQDPDQTLIATYEYNRLFQAEQDLNHHKDLSQELQRLNIELNQANAKAIESIATMNGDGVLKDLSSTIVKLTVDKYN